MKPLKPSTRQQLEKVAPYLYRHSTHGTYHAIKRVNYKLKSRKLDTTDRKIANARLRDWIAELSAVDPGNSDLTLAALLEKYQAVRTDMAPSTLVGERGRIRQFRELFPRPMDSLACRTTASDMAEWLAKVNEGKRASTRNQNRAFVRALFDFAVSARAVTVNPFDPRLCRKARKDPITRLIPSEQEFQAIVAEIRKPTWKTVEGRHGGQRPMFQHESADFAEFLGLAGVGQAEAVGLKWEDIDFEKGTIHFVRKKTKTAFRTPIHPWLEPLLSRLRATGEARGPVFKIKSVKNALASACRRLGMPHFTHRGLRAMRIKRLWEAGVDVKIIAQWQGHRDGGKLIMTIYTEVFGSTSDSYERAQSAKAALAFASA